MLACYYIVLFSTLPHLFHTLISMLDTFYPLPPALSCVLSAVLCSLTDDL